MQVTVCCCFLSRVPQFDLMIFSELLRHQIFAQVVCVISGGNVDVNLLKSYFGSITHGRSLACLTPSSQTSSLRLARPRLASAAAAAEAALERNRIIKQTATKVNGCFLSSRSCFPRFFSGLPLK
jgi:hypothetical protein